MKCFRGLLLLFFPFLMLGNTNGITFNEVMFRPVSNGNEFVEILNCSDETINLQNFSFVYQTSNSDGFIETGDGYQLQPGQLAVIFEGDYDLQNGNYAGIVPDSALVLQIDDNSFGTNGMANSSDRTVFLIDGIGDTVSVYTYTADNEAGYSDEKIIGNGENNPENWQNSLIENGTPGFKNSVSLFEYDLSLTKFSLPNSVIQINKQFTVSTTILNKGTQPAEQFYLNMFLYEYEDSLSLSPSLLFSQQYNNLQPGDSIQPQITTSVSDTGRYYLRGVVEYIEDELNVNNEKTLVIYAYDDLSTFNQIVINEIKYDPLDGEPEWVELTNNFEESINLKGWRIQDKTGYSIISQSDYILDSGDYLVLSDGEEIIDFYPVEIENLTIINLPSLNNSGDHLKITNPYGVTIDSVNYLADWGGVDGLSLERINSSSPSQDSLNWKTCEISLSATPGFVNSVSPMEYDLKMTDFEPVNLFFTPEEEVKFNVNLLNRGNNAVTGATLKIFNDFNSNGVGSNDEIVLSRVTGTIPAGAHSNNTIPIGNYPKGTYTFIASVEFAEDIFPYNDTLSTMLNVVELDVNYGDIVLNEIMYSPNNQPEWIELFSAGIEEILFRKFYIADLRDTLLIDIDEFSFNPGEYILLAEEEINPLYKKEFTTIITQLPTLNNSGDVIYLLDSLYRVIDSLSYTPDMGGGSGESLERIIPGNHLFSPENYAESTSPEGATPAGINSQSPKKFDLAITDFYLDQSYYARNEKPEISFTIKNLGYQTIPSFELVFTKENAVEEAVSLGNLNPGDSLLLDHVYGRILNGENILEAFLAFNNDEYTWNDTVTISITPVLVNEMPGDILINEIMHSPGGEMPEWVEIYNRSDKEINLRGYKLADEKDVVNLGIGDFILFPKSYYLFASDSLIFDYFTIDGGVIIKKLPTLNNSGDIVFLQDSLGRIIDSVDYNGYANLYGRSIERVTTQIIYADSANWHESKNVYGGTPNKINSVSVKAYDLEVTEITALPEFPASGNLFDLNIKISNRGTLAMPVKFNVLGNGEFVGQRSTGSLSPGATVTSTFNKVIKMTDSPVDIEVFLIENDDQYSYNDTLRKRISSGLQENSLVINEFYPFGSNNRKEWIELYNNSEKDINLKNIQIVDAAGNSMTIKENYSLKADSFVVVSDDSLLHNLFSIYNFDQIYQKIPSINNDRDELYLLDSVGVIIDSVFFDGSIGTYSSAERIDANKTGFDVKNWSNNQNNKMGSPGYINSVTPKNIDYAITGIGFTPPKLRLNEMFDVYITIENRGKISNQTPITCSLTFDDTVTNISITELPAPGERKKIVVATNKVLTGTIYAIVELPADEDIYNNLWSYYITPGADKRSVLITEFYPNPREGEAEWIELYNPGDKTVNLANWRLTDNNPQGIIPTLHPGSSLYLKSDEYMIFTTDTAAFRATYGFSAVDLYPMVLNNNADAIKLYDYQGLLVDSVEYVGSRKGYSFERLYFYDDRLIISADKNGSTPGRLNSTNGYSPVGWNEIVINEIMYEPGIDRPEFIELYSEKNLNLTGFTIEVNNSDRLLLDNNYRFNPEGYFLISTDSSFINTGVISAENCCVTDINLINSGASVKLKGLFGEVIDSLTYSPDWHNNFFADTKNISLEKINPELTNSSTSWSSSVDLSGATPGGRNSLFAKNSEGFIGIKLEPNPFSPDNDGFEDITYIKYSLNSPVPMIKVRIFDDHGRLVRTLTEGQALPQSGNILFDGRDDNGTPLRIGMYIILLEAKDSNSSRTETYKKVLVSARKF